jgi:hypothetical protein
VFAGSSDPGFLQQLFRLGTLAATQTQRQAIEIRRMGTVKIAKGLLRPPIQVSLDKLPIFPIFLAGHSSIHSHVP